MPADGSSSQPMRLSARQAVKHAAQAASAIRQSSRQAERLQGKGKALRGYSSQLEGPRHVPSGRTKRGRVSKPAPHKQHTKLLRHPGKSSSQAALRQSHGSPADRHKGCAMHALAKAVQKKAKGLAQSPPDSKRYGGERQQLQSGSAQQGEAEAVGSRRSKRAAVLNREQATPTKRLKVSCQGRPGQSSTGGSGAPGRSAPLDTEPLPSKPTARHAVPAAHARQPKRPPTARQLSFAARLLVKKASASDHSKRTKQPQCSPGGDAVEPKGRLRALTSGVQSKPGGAQQKVVVKQQSALPRNSPPEQHEQQAPIRHSSCPRRKPAAPDMVELPAAGASASKDANGDRQQGNARMGAQRQCVEHQAVQPKASEPAPTRHSSRPRRKPAAPDMVESPAAGASASMDAQVPTRQSSRTHRKPAAPDMVPSGAHALRSAVTEASKQDKRAGNKAETGEPTSPQKISLRIRPSGEHAGISVHFAEASAQGSCKHPEASSACRAGAQGATGEANKLSSGKRQLAYADVASDGAAPAAAAAAQMAPTARKSGRVAEAQAKAWSQAEVQGDARAQRHKRILAGLEAPPDGRRSISCSARHTGQTQGPAQQTLQEAAGAKASAVVPALHAKQAPAAEVESKQGDGAAMAQAASRQAKEGALAPASGQGTSASRQTRLQAIAPQQQAQPEAQQAPLQWPQHGLPFKLVAASGCRRQVPVIVAERVSSQPHVKAPGTAFTAPMQHTASAAASSIGNAAGQQPAGQQFRPGLPPAVLPRHHITSPAAANRAVHHQRQQQQPGGSAGARLGRPHAPFGLTPAQQPGQRVQLAQQPQRALLEQTTATLHARVMGAPTQQSDPQARPTSAVSYVVASASQQVGVKGGLARLPHTVIRAPGLIAAKGPEVDQIVQCLLTQTVTACILPVANDIDMKNYLVWPHQRSAILARSAGQVVTVAGLQGVAEHLPDRSFVCLHYSIGPDGSIGGTQQSSLSDSSGGEPASVLASSNLQIGLMVKRGTGGTGSMRSAARSPALQGLLHALLDPPPAAPVVAAPAGSVRLAPSAPLVSGSVACPACPAAPVSPGSSAAAAGPGSIAGSAAPAGPAASSCPAGLAANVPGSTADAAAPVNVAYPAGPAALVSPSTAHSGPIQSAGSAVLVPSGTASATNTPCPFQPAAVPNSIRSPAAVSRSAAIVQHGCMAGPAGMPCSPDPVTAVSRSTSAATGSCTRGAAAAEPMGLPYANQPAGGLPAGAAGMPAASCAAVPTTSTRPIGTTPHAGSAALADAELAPTTPPQPAARPPALAARAPSPLVIASQSGPAGPGSGMSEAAAAHVPRPAPRFDVGSQAEPASHESKAVVGGSSAPAGSKAAPPLHAGSSTTRQAAAGVMSSDCVAMAVHAPTMPSQPRPPFPGAKPTAPDAACQSSGACGSAPPVAAAQPVLACLPAAVAALQTGAALGIASDQQSVSNRHMATAAMAGSPVVTPSSAGPSAAQHGSTAGPASPAGTAAAVGGTLAACGHGASPGVACSSHLAGMFRPAHLVAAAEDQAGPAVSSSTPAACLPARAAVASVPIGTAAGLTAAACEADAADEADEELVMECPGFTPASTHPQLQQGLPTNGHSRLKLYTLSCRLEMYVQEGTWHKLPHVQQCRLLGAMHEMERRLGQLMAAWNHVRLQAYTNRLKTAICDRPVRTAMVPPAPFAQPALRQPPSLCAPVHHLARTGPQPAAVGLPVRPVAPVSCLASTAPQAACRQPAAPAQLLARTAPQPAAYGVPAGPASVQPLASCSTAPQPVAVGLPARPASANPLASPTTGPQPAVAGLPVRPAGAAPSAPPVAAMVSPVLPAGPQPPGGSVTTSGWQPVPPVLAPHTAPKVPAPLGLAQGAQPANAAGQPVGVQLTTCPDAARPVSLRVMMHAVSCGPTLEGTSQLAVLPLLAAHAQQPQQAVPSSRSNPGLPSPHGAADQDPGQAQHAGPMLSAQLQSPDEHLAHCAPETAVSKICADLVQHAAQAQLCLALGMLPGSAAQPSEAAELNDVRGVCGGLVQHACAAAPATGSSRLVASACALGTTCTPAGQSLADPCGPKSPQQQLERPLQQPLGTVAVPASRDTEEAAREVCAALVEHACKLAGGSCPSEHNPACSAMSMAGSAACLPPAVPSHSRAPPLVRGLPTSPPAVSGRQAQPQAAATPSCTPPATAATVDTNAARATASAASASFDTDAALATAAAMTLACSAAERAAAGPFPWPYYLIGTRDCFNFPLVPVTTRVRQGCRSYLKTEFFFRKGAVPDNYQSVVQELAKTAAVQPTLGTAAAGATVANATATAATPGVQAVAAIANPPCSPMLPATQPPDAASGALDVMTTGHAAVGNGRQPSLSDTPPPQQARAACNVQPTAAACVRAAPPTVPALHQAPAACSTAAGPNFRPAERCCPQPPVCHASEEVAQPASPMQPAALAPARAADVVPCLNEPADSTAILDVAAFSSPAIAPAAVDAAQPGQPRPVEPGLILHENAAAGPAAGLAADQAGDPMQVDVPVASATTSSVGEGGNAEPLEGQSEADASAHLHSPAEPVQKAGTAGIRPGRNGNAQPGRGSQQAAGAVSIAAAADSADACAEQHAGHAGLSQQMQTTQSMQRGAQAGCQSTCIGKLSCCPQAAQLRSDAPHIAAESLAGSAAAHPESAQGSGQAAGSQPGPPPSSSQQQQQQPATGLGADAAAELPMGIKGVGGRVGSGSQEQDLLPVGITTYNEVFSEAELAAIEAGADALDERRARGQLHSDSFHCTAGPGRGEGEPKRTKMFFGARYLWTRDQMEGANSHCAGGVRVDVPVGPSWLKDLVEQPLVKQGIVPHAWINSYALNHYHSGEVGIQSHFDDVGRFQRPITSLRLFSDSRLSFGTSIFGSGPASFYCDMPRGCVLVMEGYAADGVRHCVRPIDMTGKSAGLILRAIQAHALGEARALLMAETLGLLRGWSMKDAPVAADRPPHVAASGADRERVRPTTKGTGKRSELGQIRQCMDSMLRQVERRMRAEDYAQRVVAAEVRRVLDRCTTQVELAEAPLRNQVRQVINAMVAGVELSLNPGRGLVYIPAHVPGAFPYGASQQYGKRPAGPMHAAYAQQAKRPCWSQPGLARPPILYSYQPQLQARPVGSGLAGAARQAVMYSYPQRSQPGAPGSVQSVPTAAANPVYSQRPGPAAGASVQGQALQALAFAQTPLHPHQRVPGAHPQLLHAYSGQLQIQQRSAGAKSTLAGLVHTVQGSSHACSGAYVRPQQPSQGQVQATLALSDFSVLRSQPASAQSQLRAGAQAQRAGAVQQAQHQQPQQQPALVLHPQARPAPSSAQTPGLAGMPAIPGNGDQGPGRGPCQPPASAAPAGVQPGAVPAGHAQQAMHARAGGEAAASQTSSSQAQPGQPGPSPSVSTAAALPPSQGLGEGQAVNPTATCGATHPPSAGPATALPLPTVTAYGNARVGSGQTASLNPLTASNAFPAVQMGSGQAAAAGYLQGMDVRGYSQAQGGQQAAVGTSSGGAVGLGKQRGALARAPASVCFSCEQGGGGMWSCEGACRRSFHAGCRAPLVATPQAWCTECASASHSCGHCGQAPSPEAPLQKCSMRSCGRHYHPGCVAASPLTSYSGAGRAFRCPVHYCAHCGRSGDAVPMLQCIRCATGYHIRCTPAEARIISKKLIVCPKHLAGQQEPSLAEA